MIESFHLMERYCRSVYYSLRYEGFSKITKMDLDPDPWHGFLNQRSFVLDKVQEHHLRKFQNDWTSGLCLPLT